MTIRRQRTGRIWHPPKEKPPAPITYRPIDPEERRHPEADPIRGPHVDNSSALKRTGTRGGAA